MYMLCVIWSSSTLMSGLVAARQLQVDAVPTRSSSDSLLLIFSWFQSSNVAPCQFSAFESKNWSIPSTWSSLGCPTLQTSFFLLHLPNSFSHLEMRYPLTSSFQFSLPHQLAECPWQVHMHLDDKQGAHCWSKEMIPTVDVGHHGNMMSTVVHCQNHVPRHNNAAHPCFYSGHIPWADILWRHRHTPNKGCSHQHPSIRWLFSLFRVVLVVVIVIVVIVLCRRSCVVVVVFLSISCSFCCCHRHNRQSPSSLLCS